MGNEVDPVIVNQINEIFDSVEPLERPPVVVPDREIIFEPCSKLIEDAMKALRKLPDFRAGVLDNYFMHTPNKPIIVSTGVSDFSIIYRWASNSADIQESLSLTRSDKARLKLITSTTSDGSKYGEIKYSEDPNDFTIERYPLGDPQVFSIAQRMIKELQSASS